MNLVYIAILREKKQVSKKVNMNIFYTQKNVFVCLQKKNEKTDTQRLAVTIVAFEEIGR